MPKRLITYVYCGTKYPLERQLHYQTYGAICAGNAAVKKGWRKYHATHASYVASSLRTGPDSVGTTAIKALIARSLWMTNVHRVKDAYGPDVQTKKLLTCPAAGVRYGQLKGKLGKGEPCHHPLVCPSCHFRQRQAAFLALQPYLSEDATLFTTTLVTFPTDGNCAPGIKEQHSLKFMQRKFVDKQTGRVGYMFPSLGRMPSYKEHFWAVFYHAFIIGHPDCWPASPEDLGSQQGGKWEERTATKENLRDALTRGVQHKYPAPLTYKQIEVSDLKDLIQLKSTARITQYGLGAQAKKSKKEQTDERNNWSSPDGRQSPKITDMEFEAGHPVRRIQFPAADHRLRNKEQESVGVSGRSIRLKQTKHKGRIGVPRGHRDDGGSRTPGVRDTGSA